MRESKPRNTAGGHHPVTAKTNVQRQQELQYVFNVGIVFGLWGIGQH